ncbi:ATP-binding protein [Alisedimentitalea sp. MJ-SS2]|uniref:ATP-binding protein n=1 Tax=Aliisedimentitalea sp. MJ-SS2 TaxID=3049795 RepID=UPI00290B7159|nr:ATP-binding protein [Alisedimentitalea sp. MJ-SS2]MDU8926925.1 ATP-binding protein [Alisedimentitalea sp. MJ-SS2]
MHRPEQNLLDAMPQATVLIGPDERVVALNTGAEALFGAGVVGQFYIAALRQPDVLEAIELCASERVKTSARYVLRRDSGRDVTYAVSCGRIDLPGLVGVLVSFEDRSPLEQAGQMRRDFVANVSHELRTPLTSLMGFIETLRGAAKDDPAAQERFLDIMESEAGRMERLVHDLLSLSRVESDARVRPTGQVELVGLISAVLTTLEKVAGASGVTVQFNPPMDELRLSGDEDQLRQVVTNVVENAIKYGSGGGVVTLYLSKEDHDKRLRGPAAVLRVVDRGAGIETFHIPRLTERFYRVDSHRSREVGGTGLGLAIVKHIINRHRGRMRIKSKPGKGSTFTVALPLD